LTRPDPTRTAAERNLVQLLRNDELLEALEPLFELFRTFPIQESDNNRRDSAVLRPGEASVLEMIATQKRPEGPNIARLHVVFAEANITIRPPSNIPRSGHDYLVEVIDRKAGIVYQTFFPIS